MKSQNTPLLPPFIALLLAVSVFMPSAFSQKMGEDALPYQIVYHHIHKDSLFVPAAYGLKSGFSSQPDLMNYIVTIPTFLASKGYLSASIDSSWQQNDSTHLVLYTGQLFQWVRLNTNTIDPQVLAAVGYEPKAFVKKPLHMAQLQSLQTRLLNYYEKNGYPFVKIYLDSIRLVNNNMEAVLQADKGVLYHIDSIRMYGKLNLNKKFLQRYLRIPNGSIYNKEKLEEVDKRLLELPFLTPVQPSDVTLLGSGSVLNIYADAKKNSQVNFLVGFLPAAGNNDKLQITGDVNLNLKNTFGSAEEILVKWQQLQLQSPRLNLGYTHPYILNSPFGVNFLFEVFKKDSNFLQVFAQTGILYDLSANQSGKLFVQWNNNTLLSGAIDTNAIRAQKKLPVNVDVGSVNTGLQYDYLGTNYRLNPRSGNEISLTAIIGIKNIRQNADIINIKDPSFNYASLYDSIQPRSYQLRARLTAAHYFPLSKAATIKVGFNGGFFNSQSIFRNELFQIGGYKLLRGFDEESIYASSFGVFTAEYRYLLGLNSYLFGFADLGLVQNKFQEINSSNRFTGVGLGILFETKAGLLNVSYALGKRNDLPFNIREASKLHFGYINYF
jgi:outer membrane protein assembly factor BamA